MSSASEMRNRRQTTNTSGYKVSKELRNKEEKTVSSTLHKTDSSTMAAATIDEKRKVGRPTSSKTEHMTIVMEPELKKWIKTYCAVNGINVADMIDETIRPKIMKWKEETLKA